MLGVEIDDSCGTEGGGRVAGVGLLSIRTQLNAEKITVTAKGKILGGKLFGNTLDVRNISGYEIHVGETQYEETCSPFAEIFRRTDPATRVIDGAINADGKVVGTYLHGLFDADAFRHAFIAAAREACKLERAETVTFHQAEKEARYDRLAEHVRKAVDLDLIFDWLGLTRGTANSI